MSGHAIKETQAVSVPRISTVFQNQPVGLYLYQRGREKDNIHLYDSENIEPNFLIVSHNDLLFSSLETKPLSTKLPSLDPILYLVLSLQTARYPIYVIKLRNKAHGL